MIWSHSGYFLPTMQTKILSILFIAAAVSTGLRAQNAPEPSAPTQAPAPQTVASTPQAVAQPTQSAPAPSQIIYSPRLPSAAELTSVAAAQGQTVQQITQTANQVTAIYRNTNGELTTVAYQLLPTSGAPTMTVAVPSPAPTIIYEEVPRTVYYRSYDPYWPSYYPPVSLSLGFGYYRGGWGGGHYHHWR
jgi:hypothetical protein